MRKWFSISLAFLLLFLVSCNPRDLEAVNLSDPSPYSNANYTSQPSINKLIEISSHIAIVKLADREPHWTREDESIYTFSVLSLLAGEQCPDKIKVTNDTYFYEFDETYLLFMSCFSSTLQPFDIYIPFDRFTFRITENGDIDCLQRLADADTGSPRIYVKPFETPEHNSLSFLEGFIKMRARSVKKVTHASEDNDLTNLISKSDLRIEIAPTKIELTHSYAADVWFEVTECFQGTPPADNWLMLPLDVELGKKYVVLLHEEEPGYYKPVSRNSIFSEGTLEYNEFFAAWD